MPFNGDEFTTLIETWQTQKLAVFKRQPFNEGANAASLREFTEIMNRLSRRLISITGKQDPDFWQSIVELAMNTNRILEGGKVFVDKQDRSSEGM